jgi:hypothetical protein
MEKLLIGAQRFDGRSFGKTSSAVAEFLEEARNLAPVSAT